jgi:hypothetical protein
MASVGWKIKLHFYRNPETLKWRWGVVFANGKTCCDSGEDCGSRGEAETDAKRALDAIHDALHIGNGKYLLVEN